MGNINVATSGAGSSGGTAVQLGNNIMDVYSQEVLFIAQPILRFEAIVSRKEELGVAPGLKIQFLKYSALTGSATLTENTDMVADSLSSTLVPITVAERGKAVAVSELLLRSSFTSVMDDAALLLGQHLARDRDGQIRDTLLNYAGSTLYANDKTRTTLVDTDTFDTEAVRAAVETLATKKAPKIGGDAYIGFVHPHQARGLRKDPDWIAASHYGAPGQIFAGEIGRFEDVRFIETTMVPYIASTGVQYANGEQIATGKTPASGGANVYQAVIVGDHAVGLAISLEGELRDNGIKDFGRRHEIAWYGIWGTGIIMADHACIVEST